MNSCKNHGNLSHIQCISCHLKEKIVSSAKFSPLHIKENGSSTINTDYYGKGKVDLLSVKSCEGCHVSETNEWKQSGHGKSWTNPVFLSAFKREPAGWCVNCHAPLDRQALNVDTFNSTLPGGTVKISTSSPLTTEGINCAVCHVREGKIYASREPSPLARRLSIHPIEVDEELRKPSFCASCHEFPFPEHSVSLKFTNIQMQSTVKEFFNSEFHKKGESCQTCHFQDKNKKSYHGTISLNSDKIPLHLHTTKQGNNYFVALRIKKIGHALPTGDLYRQIRLRIKLENGSEKTYLHQRAPISLIHPKWGTDNRLHPGSNGIEKQYETGKFKPISCVIEFHKQGGIGSVIKLEMNSEAYQRDFVRTIYTGSCNSKD